MRTFEEYIFEEMNKHPLWCEIILGLFKSSKKLFKEEVSDMLDSLCDVEGRFKKFSMYLSEVYPKDYLPYQPNDDEFLNKDNKDKIKEQIAEFIIKFVMV